MQLGQEWRTENNNRHFPFAEGSTIPKGFISDLKLIHDKRGPQDVYLYNVAYDINSDTYSLLFVFLHGGSLNIGPIPRLHGLKQVRSFGPNNESVVIFSTGPDWDNRNYQGMGKVDNSLVSSGPNLIRRIVIHGDEEDESTWGREVVQSIIGGTNLSINLKEDNLPTKVAGSGEFIELSAVYGGGMGAPDYVPEDGILTINGVPPVGGGISIAGNDCIQEINRPNGSDNTIKIKSNCLPCCGCSSYQLISDAISYRSAQLSDLCYALNSLLASSSEKYNAAITALEKSKMPVARIRAIRVYKDSVTLALQNVCALPIYGKYAISFSNYSWNNLSATSVVPAPLLGAPAKYNSYSNTDPESIPTGDFVGVLGPISPGSFVDLKFHTASLHDVDLRTQRFSIDTQANGYFGSIPTIGCKKDEYNVTISPDSSGSDSCNSNAEATRYKIERETVP